MDPLSILLGAPRMTEAITRVMANADNQMKHLSDNMLKVAVQDKVGREMGKGGLLDLSA